MDTKTYQGYLLLADISGYTTYLAQVELDHANAVLTELLETIVARIKTLLTLCKLEGDAVLAYTPQGKIARGETLLELIETTYAAFRERVSAATRRTTCGCRACQAIPNLDLKFLVHHGDYMVQHISGIHELVGTDVNLVHRLLKNSIAQQTGWKAYALFTEGALQSLGVHPEGLHEQIEIAENLGEIRTYSLDLRQRYEAMLAAQRTVVAPEEAHVITEMEYAAPPPVVWEWLNDPQKRTQYGESVTFVDALLPGGRSGVGRRTHCIHGKKVAMRETVLYWQPFEIFTVEQKMSGMTVMASFELAEIPAGGTHLRILERGRMTRLEPVDRLITWIIFAKWQPTRKYAERMGQYLAAEQASNQV